MYPSGADLEGGVLELAVVQPGVKAILGHEAVVVPLLHDVSVPHHQDHIRLPDGGQPVGHDEVRVSMEEVASSRMSMGGR